MVDAEGMRALVDEGAARSMEALMGGVLRPLVRRTPIQLAPNPSGRRFCLLHLDGLGREVLLQGIRSGAMPFLARLVDSRQFRLSPCLSGAPSSTPAFQAGLLYGLRDPDIPGYLWYDRRQRREIRMDRPEDAAAAERRVAGGRPGLLERGSASFSVFSGGAPVDGYSMSGWAAERVNLMTEGIDAWHLAAGAVAHSLTAGRILGRLAREASSALYDFFRQLAAVGRLQHEPTFLMHRMGLAIGARELATFGAVLDLARGVPAIYVCFGDYDEIAHRRGPRSESALAALRGIDWAVERIFAAAAASPENRYDLYVVADHGQVPTVPFEEQMGGLTLVDFATAAAVGSDGRLRVADQALRSIKRYRSLDRAAQALPKGVSQRAREVALEAARASAHTRRESEWLRQLEQAVCIDAGDVAHLYLGDEPRPLALEEIRRRFPRVLQAVLGCPAVGIVAARGGRAGYAFINGAQVDLAESAGQEALELGYGGDVTREFLAQMVAIPAAGDLVAYGNGLPGSDVAFAFEFGSHAGVAREEVETFVIHPASAPFDFTRVRHGADLHEYFAQLYLRPRRTLH